VNHLAPQFKTLWLLVVAAWAATTSIAVSLESGPRQLTLVEASQAAREARALIAEGKIDTGAALLQKAASAFYIAGEYDDASEMYSELFNLENLAVERHIEAERMLAQILTYNLGNNDAAQPIWQDIVNKTGGVDSVDSRLNKHSVLLARSQAFRALAGIYRQQKKYSEAIASRNRLIEQGANVLAFAEVISKAFLENADDYISQGLRDEAVAELDKYLERHPNAGLNVKHRRARAFGYKWGTVEHIELWSDLWNDTSHQADMWRYNVGRELLGSLVHASKYAQAMQFAYELRRELAQLTESQIVELPWHLQDSIATSHSECLYYLAESQIQLGLISEASKTYEELIALFPDSPGAKYAQDQIPILLAAAKKRSDEMLALVDRLERESNLPSMQKNETPKSALRLQAEDHHVSNKTTAPAGNTAWIDRWKKMLFLICIAMVIVAVGLIVRKMRTTRR